MDSVRMSDRVTGEELDSKSCRAFTPPAPQSRGHPFSLGAPVLDVVFIAAAIALVAFVGLIAKGVEKL